MLRTDTRSRSVLRNLALAAATVMVVGAGTVTPAKAWYDAYGYWHPNHRYYYDRGYYDRDYDRHYAYRSSYEWRHHQWWCERHPSACGYDYRR